VVIRGLFPERAEPIALGLAELAELCAECVGRVVTHRLDFLRFGDLWSVQSALHAEWNSDR